MPDSGSGGRNPEQRRGVDAETNGLYEDRLGEVEKRSIADGTASVAFRRGEALNCQTYRDVQNLGNARKIDKQFVNQSQIAHLASIVSASLGVVGNGLCHGVRSGKEQAWFRAHLPNAPQVIGTDIANTATRFPDTVQWDFHDLNSEWSGKMDFVYSNSWDHAYDFEKALRAWADSLRSGGLLLLDWTQLHRPDHVSALDPFGAELDALVDLIAASGLFSSVRVEPAVSEGQRAGFATVIASRA